MFFFPLSKQELGAIYLTFILSLLCTEFSSHWIYIELILFVLKGICIALTSRENCYLYLQWPCCARYCSAYFFSPGFSGGTCSIWHNRQQREKRQNMHFDCLSFCRYKHCLQTTFIRSYLAFISFHKIFWWISSKRM